MKDLDEGQKNFLKDTLASLPFVKWDRFIPAYVDWFSVFGWISRQKDSYKDFVVLVFDLQRLIVDHYHTSSVEYSKKIGEILDFPEHIDCHNISELIGDELKG